MLNNFFNDFYIRATAIGRSSLIFLLQRVVPSQNKIKKVL